MSTPVALAVGAALLVANGFFVAAEFALLASRRSRIEQLAAAGERQAAVALEALRELSLTLAGAQLGITMASLGLGAVAEPAVAHLLESGLHRVGVPDALLHPIAFAIALSGVVFAHMVAGEMAPKSWAITHPERSALLLARPFRAFVLLFRPFIRVLNATANGVVRLAGITPQDERAMVHSPRELAFLLEESARQGKLGAEHAELLTHTLELSGRDALAAATPRWEVVAVTDDAGVDEIEAVALQSGLSRLLVHTGDLEHLVGVVHIRDVLLLDDAARPRRRAGDLATPVLVVPEHKPLEDLLVEMRRGRRHIAVVVDELGTVAGVVTLEDVLEVLIGEFDDETDRPRRAIRRLPDGRWSVSGNLRPDELADRTGLELPPGRWDTVTGYVMAALGRVPSVGDAVQAGGVTLEVASMDGYAVTEVTISPDPPSPEPLDGKGGS